MTSQALEILNFEQQLQVQDDSFKELSVLDKDGNIIDEAGFEAAELSDDKLVELMKRMIKQLVLNERSVKLAKQGRLGFVAPTRG